MSTTKPASAAQSAVTLPSPCVSVCQMDQSDEFCLGCYRTREEIASWRSMDEADQQNLLDVLSRRRVAATTAKLQRPSQQAQRLVL